MENIFSSVYDINNYRAKCRLDGKISQNKNYVCPVNEIFSEVGAVSYFPNAQINTMPTFGSIPVSLKNKMLQLNFAPFQIGNRPFLNNLSSTNLNANLRNVIFQQATPAGQFKNSVNPPPPLASSSSVFTPIATVPPTAPAPPVTAPTTVPLIIPKPRTPTPVIIPQPRTPTPPTVPTPPLPTTPTSQLTQTTQQTLTPSQAMSIISGMVTRSRAKKATGTGIKKYKNKMPKTAYKILVGSARAGNNNKKIKLIL